MLEVKKNIFQLF